MRARSTLALTLLALLLAVLSIHTPTVAEEKVTVPLEEVVKTTGECELTAEQWSKDEVTVPRTCVSEDYLAKQENIDSSDNSSEEVSPEGTSNSSNFGTIDLFELHDGDNDKEVELAAVDNDGSGSKLAFYPFWESDGDAFGTIYKLPEKIMDTSSRDIDGDGKAEFGFFSKNNAYLFDGNQDKQDFDIEKYSSNREITDGILQRNKLLISVDEPMGVVTYGIYEIDEETGQWKPYEDGDFSMEKLIKEKITKPKQEYGRPEINPGPIDEFMISDNGDRLYYTCKAVRSPGEGAEYYVIDTEENDSIPQDTPNLVLHWGQIPEDIMYENPNPFHLSKKRFILLFEDEARSQNPEKRSNMDWVSNFKKSGLDVNDFDIYPTDAMSREAQEAIGNLSEYKNYWNNIASRNGEIFYPFVMSTQDSDENGLIVTIDRDFKGKKNRRPYFFDFEYSDFLEATGDMDVVELK